MRMAVTLAAGRMKQQLAVAQMNVPKYGVIEMEPTLKPASPLALQFGATPKSPSREFEQGGQPLINGPLVESWCFKSIIDVLKISFPLFTLCKKQGFKSKSKPPMFKPPMKGQPKLCPTGLCALFLDSLQKKKAKRGFPTQKKTWPWGRKKQSLKITLLTKVLELANRESERGFRLSLQKAPSTSIPTRAQFLLQALAHGKKRTKRGNKCQLFPTNMEAATRVLKGCCPFEEPPDFHDCGKRAKKKQKTKTQSQRKEHQDCDQPRGAEIHPERGMVVALPKSGFLA